MCTEASITTDAAGRFTVEYASFDSLDDARAFVALQRRQGELRDAVVWLERFVDRTRACLDGAKAELVQVTDDLAVAQASDQSELDDTEQRLLVSSLATALHLSERSVDHGLQAASACATSFPDAVALWRSGEMHAQHVRVFADVSDGLDTELVAEFESRLLTQLNTNTGKDGSPGRLRTPAQLRRVAHRIKRQLQTVPSRERAVLAAADRGVWTEQQECGMTHLIIKTSPILAEAAYDRLRQVFKLRDRNDVRTLGQFMADAALGLLVTGTTEANDRAVQADARQVVYDDDHPHAGQPLSPADLADYQGRQRASQSATGTDGADRTDDDSADAGWGVQIGAGIVAKVSITMPATLLTTGSTGHGQPFAELAGGILIDDATALQLAAGARSWTRIFTHPVTGVAITADVYEPTASLRRLINARDQSCRFPGCHRPAARTEQDHTVDWQYGGRTTPGNLACLCRHHHVLKHRLGPHHGWRVRQTTPGHLEWFGPGGLVHSIAPDPVPTWQPAPKPRHASTAGQSGQHTTSGQSAASGRRPAAAVLDHDISIPPNNQPRRQRSPHERHPHFDDHAYQVTEPEPPDVGPRFNSDLLPDDPGEHDDVPF